jgi:xylose isomerase
LFHDPSLPSEPETRICGPGFRASPVDPMKQAIILSFLGKTQDRFSEYQTPHSPEERLRILSGIKGIDGVEIVYPYETGDPAKTAELVASLGLHFAAVNANIKKEQHLVPGAISRPIAEIRADAVRIIKEAKDYAKKVGAPLVTVCPLSDGYDNLFQVDYGKAWKHMVEAVGDAAAYLPEIPLFVEYKYSETRVHCHLDSCAKVLLLLKEIGNPATGVTIDFGHSLYSQENPAAMIALCAETGVDYYLHTNDNDSRFDWDLAAGTRHFLGYVEFLFYAREYGYDRYFTTDASPRIFDMNRFFERHASITHGIWELVGRLDRSKYRKLMEEEKYMDLLELVQRELLRI